MKCPAIFAARRRMGGVDHREVLGAEGNRTRRGVLARVRRIGRLRDGDDVAVAHGPGDGDLCRGRVVALRDRRQCFGLQQPPALPQWRVGHQRDLPFGAPRQQVVLDAAAADMVQHLVAGALRAARQPHQFLHVAGVEVRHTPVADLPRGPQRLECLHCLGQRMAATPVQQIEVDPVGTQPLQTALARRRHACAEAFCGYTLLTMNSLSR